MKWINLKNNKCPDCGKGFTIFSKDSIKCSCGFKISIRRFNDIITDMGNNYQYSKSKEREIEDNQQALSEL